MYLCNPRTLVRVCGTATRKERRMSATTENQAQLKVLVPHEMRRAIKIRVAQKETTVREFVEHAIERALDEERETEK